MIAAVDKGGHIVMQLDESLTDTAMFDEGKLVAMHIRSSRYGYAEMLQDMKTRLGEPMRVDDVVSQNGYGATFHHPRAVWLTPTVGAVLEETTNYGNVIGYYTATELDIVTADEMNRELKAQEANRVDTLR